MKTLVVLLLATLAGVGALVWLAEGRAGMVVIQWGHYGFQSSLPVFAVLLVLAYLLVRLVLVLVLQLWRFRFARRFFEWLAQRRARNQTARGFVDLAEGEWESASRNLENAAENANLPLANYIQAARAANKLGNYERRDALLDQATTALPDQRKRMGLSRADVGRARIAIGIARAEMQRACGQLAASLQTLEQLLDLAPRNTRLLRLKAEVHEAMSEWDALQAMRKTLRRNRVLPADQLTALEARIWANKVHADVQDKPEETSLAAEWKRLGRRTRQNEAFVAGFVTELHHFGDHDLAADTLTKALGRVWSTRLVRLYGLTRPADMAAHKAAAEAWLGNHPQDAELRTALGRITLRMGDLVAARDYFEHSLQLRSDAEVEGELARVYVSMGDTDNGLRLMESAFERLEKRLVDVTARVPPVDVIEAMN